MRRDLRSAKNAPLPTRRRDPVTIPEAAYFVDRLGRRTWQTLSTMTGASQASLRRAVPLAEQGAPAELLDPPPPRCSFGRLPATPRRVASLSLTEAARELGLSTDALLSWLLQARWVRRGRCGSLIAGAQQLTATHLNQPVEYTLVGRRGVRTHYGAIRFTPRGMANLRASVAATCGAAR